MKNPPSKNKKQPRMVLKDEEIIKEFIKGAFHDYGNDDDDENGGEK